MGDLSEGYMGIILGCFLQTQSYPPENREGRGQGRLCGLTVSDLQEKGIQEHKAGEQSQWGRSGAFVPLRCLREEDQDSRG